MDSKHTYLNATMTLLIFWTPLNVKSHQNWHILKNQFYNLLIIQSTGGFSKFLPWYVNLPLSTPLSPGRNNTLRMVSCGTDPYSLVNQPLICFTLISQLVTVWMPAKMKLFQLYGRGHLWILRETFPSDQWRKCDRSQKVHKQKQHKCRWRKNECPR